MTGDFGSPLFNEVGFNEGAVVTPPPVTSTAGSLVLVDWEKDGDFGGDYDDVSDLVDVDAGITAERGKDQIQQLSPPIAGQSNVYLRNYDKLFSAWNTDSPLYGNLKPGRKFQWRLSVNGNTYYLYTGRTQRIPQHPRFSERTVEVTTLGNLSRLVGKRLTTAVYSDITISEALTVLLDAAGWAADEREISDSAVILSYWWLDNQDAFAAMQELLQTEGLGASVFEDGRGYLVFQDRTYRQTNSATSQYTFRTSGTNGNVRFMEADAGLDDVLNSCEVEVVSRVLQDESVVWTLGESLTIAPGETRNLTINAAAGDPIINAVVPDASAGNNEIQELRVAGSPSGGTIGLSFEGVSAPNVAKNALALPYTALAADVQTALETMSSIGTGNVSCTGISLLTGVSVEFQGDLAKQDVALISVSSQLTGGTNPTATSRVIQDGTPPDYVLADGSVDSITLNRDSGAELTLTITAGAAGALIENLQMRGQLLTVASTTKLSNTIDASESLADYGEKPFKPTIRRELSLSYGQDYCNDVVMYYKDPKANVPVQITGFTDALIEAMVTLEVSSRVTIVDEHSGLSNDFFIEKVKHDWADFVLYTTFSCEETIGGASGGSNAIVGTSVVGTAMI